MVIFVTSAGISSILLAIIFVVFVVKTYPTLLVKELQSQYVLPAYCMVIATFVLKGDVAEVDEWG